VLPSAPEEDLTSFEKLAPIQQLIVTTLTIAPHLYDRTPQAKVNIRLAYSKYLAVLDTFTSIARLILSGDWTQKKKPTNDDMIDIFISKSAWFQNHSKIFPLVKRSPAIEKWLLGAVDAPTDFEVWGHEKQTFDILMSTLSALPDPGSLVNTKKGKGKEKETERAMSEACPSPVAVKKKKKETKKTAQKERKKERDSKASTSKGRYADK
jgi:hypothetical protein